MDRKRNDSWERLLSPEEVAGVCGLSRRAVYRAITRGELDAARLCNRLRIQPAELERWIGESAIGTAAVPRSHRVRRLSLSERRGSLRAKLDELTEDDG